MNFDIGLLDIDTYLRESMISTLRLYHRDFPAGLFHVSRTHHGPGDGCLICDMVSIGFLTFDIFNAKREGWKVVINPDFVPFLSDDTDDGYVAAMKGYVAYRGIVSEIDVDLKNVAVT